MTNLEKIRDIPKEELAKLLVKKKDEDMWDYDSVLLYTAHIYYHPFSSYKFSKYDNALEDCVKCLDKKFKGFDIEYDK